MAPVPYFTVILSKDHKFDYRLRLVHYAREHGIKAAARTFSCARNTVRTWLRRYQPGCRSSLQEKSRAPRRCPHKTSKQIEQRVIEARTRSGFGAERLKDEFKLPCSAGATARILRHAGLTHKPRKRRQKKNDLRAVKAAYQAFTRFQMDTKFLRDIAFYWPQMKHLALPQVQYTIREVVTGASFVAFADEQSAFNAELVVRRFLLHLRACGINTTQVILQSDNGSEFISHDGVTATIERAFNATHRFNPVGRPNANADVESFHATIERELFDRELFNNRHTFLLKVRGYQLYYNLRRTILTKAKRSPLRVLRDKDATLDPRLLLLAPIDVDTMLRNTPPHTPQGGQDLPAETDSLADAAPDGVGRRYR